MIDCMNYAMIAESFEMAAESEPTKTVELTRIAKEYRAFAMIDAHSKHAAKTAFTTWARAKQQFPNLRFPWVTIVDENVHMSWTFKDIRPDSFTIDINTNGMVEWFYSGPLSTTAVGTEDEHELEVPDRALAYLARFDNILRS